MDDYYFNESDTIDNFNSLAKKVDKVLTKNAGNYNIWQITEPELTRDDRLDEVLWFEYSGKQYRR